MRHVMDATAKETKDKRNLEKAALCGEPSYVWRAGQERRLQMILQAGGDCSSGRVLENGCGVGMYAEHLALYTNSLTGLEYDFERAVEAHQRTAQITCATGEALPFQAASFDLILSHEVLEHVQDDRQAMIEIVRVLRQGGRAVIFVPNRGYPFETHGIYWRGKYHFGNIPLVNYLPHRLRDRLAPHVRVYSTEDLLLLIKALPVKVVERTILFGAYDNIIARYPRFGHALRDILHKLEKSPLRVFGLSHFLVIEKLSQVSPG
jgi:SAM-dependent methyltransferase